MLDSLTKKWYSEAIGGGRETGNGFRLGVPFPFVLSSTPQTEYPRMGECMGIPRLLEKGVSS